MNILIPHTWLLEHLKTTATPKEIQTYLSLCGPSVERIYEREGDSVYDIEVTTNRVDCMSVRGIAREAAVILNQFGKKSSLKPLTSKRPAIKQLIKKMQLPQVINDEGWCSRTMFMVLTDVQRATTPEWMAERLRQVEMNVHDVAIDITNYITHELGHPCHAFDYDKVMELGGIVHITAAKKGKKFVTLDGNEYTTVGGEVVFENGDGVIIDLPGIKGTKNTSIQADTKNVLFWIESVTPEKIRFASMTHAIRTVAAQLNEKRVDPYGADAVFDRGVELFASLASAGFGSTIQDSFSKPPRPAAVELPLTRVTDYLGVELPVNQMAEILESLECTVELHGGKKKSDSALLRVTPPTFRPDIAIPADVIEEIARIYGYHNLPSVIMPTAIPLQRQSGTNIALEQRVKRFLADVGWQEVYTYSMVSAEVAEASGFALADHLAIQNPLSDDRVYLRRSLLPSLEEVLAANPLRPQLSVFEIANIYPPTEDGLPAEALQLGIVSSAPYRQAKGVIEALLRQFFIADVQFVQTGSSAQIFAAKTMLGSLTVNAAGHLHAQISIKALIDVAQSHPEYRPAAKTNIIVEDLTFTLPEHTEVGTMLKELTKNFPLIEYVELKSEYQRNKTFTFFYNNRQRNMTDDEVMQLRKAIVDEVAAKWNGSLVGSI